MSRHLETALEHPLITALQHAGLAAQAAALELVRANSVPSNKVEFADLVEAMLLDQRGFAGRSDRHLLVTRGLDYQVAPEAARSRRKLRDQLTDALLGFSVSERRLIIDALAAGAGAALIEAGEQARHERNQAIESGLSHSACGHDGSPESVKRPE